MRTNLNMSLREHLLKYCDRNELRRIIYHLSGSCKYISNLLSECNRKVLDSTNSTGDTQLEVDVLSNKLLLERLRGDTSFGVNEYASEEMDKIAKLDTNSGIYSVAVDPVDGSSLAHVNLSVGTIVAIYEGSILSGRGGRDNLVGAMYVLYGPLTTLVYTIKQGVHEFVLDPTGNFVLTTSDITLHEKGSIYCPGGLKKDWMEEHRSFIASLEEEGYKLRYSGGLVGDMNQILLKGGGIFTYPALKDNPQSKLRTLFELQPMAMLVEQAGGLATDGNENILDRVPGDMDDRSPIYIGSKYEVTQAETFLKKSEISAGV
jgi:fructose-1,6-bisphosphatase I